MKLAWDLTGKRTYETGVDHGVLYLPDEAGAYVDGVPWNGLVSVTESPSGAEANTQYADNIKYLNLYSAEEFKATMEAFTYPDEFAQFDGLWVPTPGIAIAQQLRGRFGISYRSIRGDDISGDAAGSKLHLVYGLTAAPSEKAYTTVNDSPEAVTFSWELNSVPVAVTGKKPTSIVTIDTSLVDADSLAALELILYGDVAVNPRLPLPDEVVALFGGVPVPVMPVMPVYDGGTHTITIPVTAGVTYYIDGEAQAAGPVVIAADTVVTARPNPGNVFAAGADDDWAYDYV